MLAASAGQVVSIGQSASSAALARSSAARSRCRRRGRTAIASQPKQAQDRVAARRPQPAQGGQEKVVEHELPAQNAAQPPRTEREPSPFQLASSPHERGPCSAANDLRR